MAWHLTYSPETRRWLRGLGPAERARIAVALEALEQHGPHLPGRLSKRIKSSRHHNMRELRSVGGNLRVLFAFDPSRRAVMLVGGDKTNSWERWYRENVPRADRLYDQHLRGGGPWRDPRTGGRSSER